MPPKRSKPGLADCKAMTASGHRCKAKPHKDGLCFFHSDPQRAAELGRKGGVHAIFYVQTGRLRVILPGGGCPEHQTTGPLPQPSAESDSPCSRLSNRPTNKTRTPAPNHTGGISSLRN
jgi:general stress protein YciG